MWLGASAACVGTYTDTLHQNVAFCLTAAWTKSAAVRQLGRAKEPEGAALAVHGEGDERRGLGVAGGHEPVVHAPRDGEGLGWPSQQPRLALAFRATDEVADDASLSIIARLMAHRPLEVGG